MGGISDHQQRTCRRDQPADMIAEAGPGAAQTCRDQLRQVEREAAEDPEHCPADEKAPVVHSASRSTQ